MKSIKVIELLMTLAKSRKQNSCIIVYKYWPHDKIIISDNNKFYKNSSIDNYDRHIGISYNVKNILIEYSKRMSENNSIIDIDSFIDIPIFDSEQIDFYVPTLDEIKENFQ